MPYTADATDVTNPLDVGISATTAPSEFRTLKTYIRDVITGTVRCLGNIRLKNGFAITGLDLAGTTDWNLISKAANDHVVVGHGLVQMDLNANTFVFTAGAQNVFINPFGIGYNVAPVTGSFALDIVGSARFSTFMKLTPSTTPATPTAGMIYYDSTLNKARCYDGAAWNNLW